MIIRDTCILCGTTLIPIERTPGNQLHPTMDTCLVRFTDRYGIAVDPESIVTFEEASETTAEHDPDIIDLNRWPRTDLVLQKAFDELHVPRLGGQSSGRGWTSIALFQKCPYAWKRRYELETEARKRGTQLIMPESEGIAVGSLVHTFLALHYSNLVTGFPHYGISPEQIKDRCLREANPKFVNEAWRVFVGYRLHYQYEDEQILPLGIEHDLRDPRTGESCRYDLIAHFPEPTLMRQAGTFIIEHKTAKIFDRGVTEGWANDGEVLGQVYAWRNLKLDLRFGELQGVLVNVLGKQVKEQKFHRMLVAPSSWQLDEHGRDLKRWEGLIQLSRGSSNFPRARNACVNKFGFCEHYEHCATNE